MLGFGALAEFPLASAAVDDTQILDQTAIFTDGDTFGAQSVALTLATTLYADADVFNPQDVSFSIDPVLYADPDVFGEPRLDLELSVSLYTDADILGEPNVGLLLQPTLHVDADTFNITRLAYSRSRLFGSVRSDNHGAFVAGVQVGSVSVRTKIKAG